MVESLVWLQTINAGGQSFGRRPDGVEGFRRKFTLFVAAGSQVIEVFLTQLVWRLEHVTERIAVCRRPIDLSKIVPFQHAI